MKDKKKIEKNTIFKRAIFTLKKRIFLVVIISLVVLNYIMIRSDLSDPSNGVLFFAINMVGITVLGFVNLYYNNDQFRARVEDEGIITKDFMESGKIRIINRLYSYHLDNSKYSRVKATLLNVYDVTLGGSFSKSTMLKYSFLDRKGNEYIGFKRITNWMFGFGEYTIKEGDQIEVIYNDQDPKESVIFYKKNEKLKWYQFFPRNEIVIVSN